MIDEISCVTFIGGDYAPDEINSLASLIRNQYPGLKIGWYSAEDTITLFTEYQNFDYLKFGPYKQKCGGLHSPKTNQRLYKVNGTKLSDMTKSLWK